MQNAVPGSGKWADAMEYVAFEGLSHMRTEMHRPGLSDGKWYLMVDSKGKRYGYQ